MLLLCFSVRKVCTQQRGRLDNIWDKSIPALDSSTRDRSHCPSCGQHGIIRLLQAATDHCCRQVHNIISHTSAHLKDRINSLYSSLIGSTIFLRHKCTVGKRTDPSHIAFPSSYAEFRAWTWHRSQPKVQHAASKHGWSIRLAPGRALRSMAPIRIH